MELVRAILFALEEHEHGYAPQKLNLEGFTEEQIQYHAYMMIQAGLVEGIPTTNYANESPAAVINNLTWQGHEFVSNARNDKVWKKAMQSVRDSGGKVSIGVFIQLLAAIAKSQLGLP